MDLDAKNSSTDSSSTSNEYLIAFRSAMAVCPPDMWRLFDPALSDERRRELFHWNVTHQDTLRKRYSYAIPTSDALDVLQHFGRSPPRAMNSAATAATTTAAATSSSAAAGGGVSGSGERSIVEIGAGTGFWASLLRARGCTVHAYDRTPPKLPAPLPTSSIASSTAIAASQTATASASVATDSKSINNSVANPNRDTESDDIEPPPASGNTYHPNSNCWTDVATGGPEKILQHPDSTLFLCWPPDFNDMAEQCLRVYRGEYVILIGEFLGRSLHSGFGLTGDAAFQLRLANDYHEIVRLPLPNWPATLDYLSVWKRTTKTMYMGREWSFIPPQEVMSHAGYSPFGLELMSSTRTVLPASPAATSITSQSAESGPASKKRK